MKNLPNRFRQLYDQGCSLHEIADDTELCGIWLTEIQDRQIRYLRVWRLARKMVSTGDLKARAEQTGRRNRRKTKMAPEILPEQATRPVQEKHDKTRDSWNIELGPTPIQSEEQLLTHFQVDTNIWFVERMIINKWDMGYVDPIKKEAASLPLFQIKAYLKKRVVVEETTRILAEMKAAASTHSPVYRPFIRIPRVLGTNLLEIAIPDAHFGKYAWHEETRADYDVTIAEVLYREALEDIVCKATANYEFDRVVYVIGNDLLNADNLENTTTAGTPQTTDGRQHRTFRRAKTTIIAAIERLMPIADVDVIVVPGNHDRMTCWYLGDTLESWFNKAPNVRIQNAPALRKYYEYGANMLLFTHGSEEKHQLLSQIAAHEEPLMWSRTRYREAHIGHLHKAMLMRTLNDEHGFRVRMLPSLCAAEDWHASRGFVGAVRSAEALVWSWERGLVGQHIYNVPSCYEGDVKLYGGPEK